MADKYLNTLKAIAQLNPKSNDRPTSRFNEYKSRMQADNRTTVLLVEDEPSHIELATTVLCENNYHVLVATTVKEAIYHLQSNSDVAIILCDIRLPGDDGFSLLEYLLTNLRFARIPVVMCTSCAEQNMVKYALELGASDYLSKPYTPEALIEKVKKILHMQKISVLLVSDCKETLLFLGRALEQRQCKILIAGNGLDAIQLLDEVIPDVVISDLGLTDCTGPDLMASIKEKHSKMPIFLISENSAKITNEDIIAAGGNGLIKRPLYGAEVYQKIKAATSEMTRSRLSVGKSI